MSTGPFPGGAPRNHTGPEIVEVSPMPDDRPSKPFFLVIADHDQGFFSVEGPVTDDQPWNNAPATPGTIFTPETLFRSKARRHKI